MQNHSVKFKSFKFLVFFSFYFLAFSFSGAGWAIENPVGSPQVHRMPAVRHPVDYGGVPRTGRVPSSSRSGLIRSPNPIDTSSNLIITGNVGGGRHFRGIVPYRSTSDFWVPIGSSSLDSFLRHSAGSGDLGRFFWKSRPYYSASGTVTATRPGYTEVFRPPTTKIGGSAAGGFALPGVLRKKALSGSGTAEENALGIKGIWEPALNTCGRAIRHRPMSRTAEELERTFSSETGRFVKDEQASVQSVPRDPSLVSRVTGDERRATNVYEQMRREVDKLRKTLEPLPVDRQAKEATDGDKESDEEISRKKSFLLDESRSIRRPPAMLRDDLSRKARGDRDPATTPELSGVDLPVAVRKDSRAELFVKAKVILGEHKTFASFAEDKFNQYMIAGEYYLKRGKCYRAADAYTLASLYKPDDPLAYAGKSHALFVAGEYMSSALFLSRALKIFPEYARFKIDLVAMVGDRDKLESRIVDIRQWLERSDVAELQFLLGYVYYQMGKLEWAKGAMDEAYEKIPESPAVVALKEAIDDANK